MVLKVKKIGVAPKGCDAITINYKLMTIDCLKVLLRYLLEYSSNLL